MPGSGGPPSGTVTFLFTDLEGSTRLWEEHPDGMRAALARHDEILRDAVTSHGGRIVKATGDGVHAVFSAAGDAGHAAIQAQRAMSIEPWEATGQLRVRMGIHTGEVEHRDGDYYGSAVNRAARLAAAAHGGQVIASLASEELIRDSLASDVRLVDLGEHRLRDLTRLERVFELRAQEMERDFPRLRSLEVYSGNLPVQLTSFVGRDEDLASVARARSMKFDWSP